MSESDFGRYLATVAERDIDLLLMEEFKCNDALVGWFCASLGMTEVEAGSAWHSVSDTDGETDLLLRVSVGARRVGILIDNKISAIKQDRQDERYHTRAARSRDAGKFDDYVTVICAPEGYLRGLRANSTYQHKMSYEGIADWFANHDGRRAAWRCRIMREAIQQGRRGYTMVVNTARTAFHLAYWKHLRRRHPAIQMAKPASKGSNSNWIIMAGQAFPKGVKLHHKTDQRTMELGFEGHSVEGLRRAFIRLPEGAVAVQKGKTASLVMAVPALDMDIALELQVEALEEALAAAHLLLPLASLLSDAR